MNKALRDSRLATLGILVVALALGGALLGRIAEPVWAAMRAREPALRLDSPGLAAGQGVTLALLGGFRTLVADATWIRMYVGWEKRDLAGTDTLLRLVTAIDPRPVHFWLNGARIIAYDLPVWRLESAGSDGVSPAREREIDREQARQALEHLARAEQFHPRSPELWTERANLQLNRLGDLAAAAESYRRAWELPHAPYYTARLHAEILRRMGRREEALAWLVGLHPTLPRDVEGAAADVVLARIRELEQQLAVPPERAYRPPP